MKDNILKAEIRVEEARLKCRKSNSDIELKYLRVEDLIKKLSQAHEDVKSTQQEVFESNANLSEMVKRLKNEFIQYADYLSKV